LPEERGLYKNVRLVELLTYLGTLKGMKPAEATRRAGELLDEVGLGANKKSKVSELSRGMSQKVQFIATIIHKPELIIIDEPFSGLDPVNRDVMRDTILQMKRDGRTVIFSTHVMEQAEQLCDQVMMIHKGRLQFAGPLSQIKAGRDFGIQLDYDGDGNVLQQLPGLDRINDSGKSAEIYLRHGADPQQALRWLLDHVVVRRFDYREPSLHEIFVRTVEAANEQLEAAAAGGKN
jgi:ABC-2 type transport system ATP-binding protein